MKRSFLLSFVLVLFLVSSVGASSWNWWAPSAPSGAGDSAWGGQILWPELSQPSWPPLNSTARSIPPGYSARKPGGAN